MAADLRLKVLELQREISQNLREAKSKEGSDRLARVFHIIQSFDQLGARLYQIRALNPPQPALTRQAEDIVAALSHELVQLRREEASDSPYGHFITRYRLLWRQNFGLFLFTAFLFVGTCFVGWELAVNSPAYVPVIVSQPLMEDILEKHAWFHKLRRTPLLGGIQIAVNNIKVGLYTCLGGALLGLGGLFLLIFNGVMFGALIGFCYVHHFNTALTDFVVGHGVLELTIIVAAAFSGFVFGRAFYMRPLRLFRARINRAAADAGILICGILPWLLLAASIEAFVSPWSSIPFKAKFLLGVFCGTLFWIWTFLPVSYSKQKEIGEDPRKAVR